MSNFPSSFMTAATQSSGNSLTGTQSIAVNDATANGPAMVLSLAHNTSGTASAGIGVGVHLKAESATGESRVAGGLIASHSAVTDSAEVGLVRILAGDAGDLGAGLKIQGVAGAVNGFEMTCAATSGAPTFAPYGADSNIAMPFKAKGTGAVQVQTPGGTTIFSVLSTGGLTVYADTQTGASPTVSRPAGKVRVQSGGATVTVTNTLVTTSSLILVTPQSAPTNAVYVKSVVPGSGSFVVTLSGDPGASHLDLAFLVLN